jgi:hypothetical protein
VKSLGAEEPLPFLAVNTHLLYGDNSAKLDRKREFFALIEWLCIRAKKTDRTYYKNFMLLGDCNLDFEATNTRRDRIDEYLKEINESRLKSRKAAKANFPLLTPHPRSGDITTNARENQTYDQIAFFSHDKRLPEAKENASAASHGPDGYDYGVFRFTDLIAQALYQKSLDSLSDAETDYVIERCEYDISDHLPAWVRLPVPGARD